MILHCAIQKLLKMKKSCIKLLTMMLHSAIFIRKGGDATVVNTNKLKGRIVENGYKQSDVAAFLNIAQPTLNQKINNIRPMDLDEAEKLAQFLHISDPRGWVSTSGPYRHLHPSSPA